MLAGMVVDKQQTWGDTYAAQLVQVAPVAVAVHLQGPGAIAGIVKAFVGGGGTWPLAASVHV